MLWCHLPFSQRVHFHTYIKCVFKAFPTNMSPPIICLLHLSKHIRVWNQKAQKISYMPWWGNYCLIHGNQTDQFFWKMTGIFNDFCEWAECGNCYNFQQGETEEMEVNNKKDCRSATMCSLRSHSLAGTESKKQVCLLLTFKYLLYRQDLQGWICDII